MKPKVNIDFQTFNDGVLDIWAIDNSGELEKIRYEKVHFENRTIGAIRHFAAAQANIAFSDLIRIPYISGITSYDCIIINGIKHEIKQIQNILNSNPPCIDLTLEKRGNIS